MALRRDGLALVLSAVLWSALGSGAIGLGGCASDRGPDDPAYDSEQNSDEVLMDEEREWEERDSDL